MDVKNFLPLYTADKTVEVVLVHEYHCVFSK